MTTSRDCKEIKPVNPEGNEPWIFTGRTDAETETPALATWCEELTPWKRPWCWARLKAGGEGDDRGWDDWMASLTQWTCVWAWSGSWWWTGRPGVLQSMGLLRAGHNWATKLNWNEPNWSHGSQPCLTQRNYEPCGGGPPKTDRSCWRVLTKCGPLQKGMANHFSILALRIPWTVWKGKKMGHCKMNSPGW